MIRISVIFNEDQAFPQSLSFCHKASEYFWQFQKANSYFLFSFSIKNCLSNEAGQLGDAYFKDFLAFLYLFSSSFSNPITIVNPFYPKLITTHNNPSIQSIT